MKLMIKTELVLKPITITHLLLAGYIWNIGGLNGFIGIHLIPQNGLYLLSGG